MNISHIVPEDIRAKALATSTKFDLDSYLAFRDAIPTLVDQIEILITEVKRLSANETKGK